ncbi:gluconate 2-dehydrogenase subunit 3 family protein [Ruegeria sp. HKCCD8929]|uniref:gluconate 2-dehydrogenase subunit 3 family protein n=1 Tax=Ruegeria sp. HKCCD8929 TaxID=2683006 RepID=UPI0014899B46|nr:gluconate 2-dehydrogenase subunit 3 family protein [Ruegeria sp. HKCCD8929]
MSIQTEHPKFKKRESEGLSRRGFLVKSVLAGVSATAIVGAGNNAFAATLNEDQAATLLQMVQDIFPHPDFLPLSIYQDVLKGVLTEAESTEETATLLAEGLKDLNARSTELHGVPYADVDAYAKREGLLRIIQDGAFFQKLRWATWAGIYINPEAWPQFGYEGSSWEHGGYIDRGFSDATWLPPGPTLEERMKAVGK